MSRPPTSVPHRPPSGRSAAWALLAWFVCAAWGCGAGVIVGGIAGGGGSGGGAAAVDTLTLSRADGPLAIDAEEEFYLRRALVRGPSVRPGLDFEVALRWSGSAGPVEVVQTQVQIERDAESAGITFLLGTAAILAAVGDPTATDVDAEVVVRGRRADETLGVVLRAPFVLRRQPRLTLIPDDPQRQLTIVPVSGGPMRLRVDGAPAQGPVQWSVEVGTRDPDPPGGVARFVIRQAPLVASERMPDGSYELQCTAPSSFFPIDGFVRVWSDLTGRSTVTGGLIYRPEPLATVSRRGRTDGGDLVTLSGRGLVPFDQSVVPSPLDFSKVEIAFEKNGRLSVLPAERLRPTLSSSSALVFVTPPSPDGRPGPVNLRLRVQVPQEVTVVAEDLFAYAAEGPDFEQRGVEFPAALSASAVGPLRHAIGASSPVDAAAAIVDGIGVPLVQVYEGRDNGMFTRLGPPVLSADRSVSGQRHPRALLFGDFHGDGRGDLLVVNRGTTLAIATLLAGRGDAAAPLQLAGPAFPLLAPPDVGVVARLDGDARDDVAVFGATDVARSTVTARPDANGAFRTDVVFGATIPPRLEMLAVHDVDRDGHADLVFAAAGPDARLEICYGPATGGFAVRRSVDLSTIAEIASSRIVGLHPGPSDLAADALLAICTDASQGRGYAFLVRPTGVREYAAPPAAEPLTGIVPQRSLVADLDGDGSREILIGYDDGAVRLYRFTTDGIVEVPGAVPIEPLEYGRILDLAVGHVGTDAAGAPIRALFVTHEQPPTASSRPRITTLLAAPGPLLEHPRSERTADLPIACVALGQVQEPAPRGAAGAVTAHPGVLEVWTNDGLGRLTAARRHPVSGLVAATLTGVPTEPGGAVRRFVLLTEDGRLGWLDPDVEAVRFVPTPLFAGPGVVAAGSRIRAGDVDGDGRLDLMVLLSLERPTGLEQHLALLRGVAEPAPEPWLPPTPEAVVALPYEATDVALGDFGPEADGHGRRLEVALAVPFGATPGVHFFRHEARPDPAGHRLLPASPDPALPPVASGIAPGALVATDLDADRRDDLVAVSATRDTIHVLRQSGATAGETPGIVDPRRFDETAEELIPEGRPLRVLAVDVDGDRIDDVVLHSRRRDDPTQHAIAVYVLNGLDGFSDRRVLAEDHIGRAGPGMAIDIGDVNGDGLADLAIGWSGANDGTDAHLRFLFGTWR